MENGAFGNGRAVGISRKIPRKIPRDRNAPSTSDLYDGPTRCLSLRRNLFERNRDNDDDNDGDNDDDDDDDGVATRGL